MILVLAFIALCIASFISERHEKLENALNDSSSWKFGFSYDGEVYAYNSSGGYTFLRKLGDEENYILLPGYTLDWSDAIEKVVYSDGKKIKAFDINTENTETLYKFSNERAVIMQSILDKYALIEGAMMGGNGYQLIGSTYLLNIETGDAIKTEMATGRFQLLLGISEDYLYYFDCYITELRTDLCRCDLTTGKCEILAAELPEYHGDSGCIIGDYLYFNYDPYYGSGDVVRYSLNSGELEKLELGIETRYIAEYKGNLLVTYYSPAENDTGKNINICIFDVENQNLKEVASAPLGNSSASGIRVYDGFVVVSAYRSVFSVELPE